MENSRCAAEQRFISDSSLPITLIHRRINCSFSRMFAALPRLARMAVKLRRNEKRILRRTISVCEAQIGEILAR